MFFFFIQTLWKRVESSPTANDILFWIILSFVFPTIVEVDNKYLLENDGIIDAVDFYLTKVTNKLI